MRREYCSDSDIKHFTFTNQLMKLMINYRLAFIVSISLLPKFLTHARIKYKELLLICVLIYVKKIHYFLSSTKRDAHKRK